MVGAFESWKDKGRREKSVRDRKIFFLRLRSREHAEFSRPWHRKRHYAVMMAQTFRLGFLRLRGLEQERLRQVIERSAADEKD